VAEAEHQSAAAANWTPLVLPPIDETTSAPLAAQAESAVVALKRAADQFVVNIPQDASDTSAAPAAVAVHTHYPWSAPSGRGAMIGFAGLFLVTGRFQEGRSLLLSMAGHLKDGLMPSEFPESGAAPLYNGADVSPWFANAVWQYLRYTADETTVRRHLFDALLQIVERYRRGTGLGIRADADGLVSSHQPGQGTSWMDARVGNWVITARQGRPVELNALWYNAVCSTAELAERFGRHDRAKDLRDLAAAIKAGFNRRFWNEPAGCCYDVVIDNGFDPSVRPNQIFAVSLPFAVLSIDRHAAVVEKVKSELLTPLGLRTLSPADPGYQGKYGGGVTSRDRAYHNGSAYPWLLGPFVSAYLRVHGRSEPARREAAAFLRPAVEYLRGDGLGQICELFDGSAPQEPGGARASAPAVAEILRSYEEDVLDRVPAAAAATAGMASADGPTVVRPLPMSPKG
jgi:predicted glycogen debranching enzyme